MNNLDFYPSAEDLLSPDIMVFDASDFIDVSSLDTPPDTTDPALSAWAALVRACRLYSGEPGEPEESIIRKNLELVIEDLRERQALHALPATEAPAPTGTNHKLVPRAI